MEFLFLLGLLLLAFPIIAIVALVKASGAKNLLWAIERRVTLLERRLAEAPAAPVQPAPPEPEGEPEPPPIHVPLPPTLAPEQRTEPVAPPPPWPPTEPPAIKRPFSLPPFAGEPPPRDAGSPIAPPPPPAASPPDAPEQRAISFEERFGTQWTVWVGGVALAFGGFFLLRYSIEQGWFGPGFRVLLGAVLAIAMIAAGEWARRTENLTGIGGLPSAHIPSVLTAAGTTVAYADIYAAYGLYGFIGPGAAFVLLGLVALATLFAALLHGPALAGLGLVGAYVTPLIVSTGRPNFWALYIYLAVVTAAAFALARIRLWRWLALTAVAFGLLWTFPGLDVPAFIAPHAFHIVVGFALAAALIVSNLLFGPDAEPGQIDGVSSVALAAYLIAAALLVLATRHDAIALIVFVVLVAATVMIAWRSDAGFGAVPVAALLVALVFAQYAVDFNYETLVLPSGPTARSIPEPERVRYGWQLVLGAGFAALFGGAGFLAQGRARQPNIPILWAACAVFVPVAILIALYYRIYGFDRSLPFAGMGLLLAALFAVATEALARREPRPGMAGAGAIFATGAVAALALALTMALEKGWLTIALALMVPGIAWIADQRPLPGLRVLAAVLVAIVMARVAWEPRIMGADVGTRPIFNWLLYGYGVPALSFWGAGYLLRRRADDAPARMTDSAALLFTVLLAFGEIRHLMNQGDVYRDGAGLAEVALQVSVGLAMTIGLERLRERTHSVVHDVGALIIAALTLAGIVLGLFTAENPMVTGEAVGGRFINLILLGYALPAALVAALALLTRGRRPQAYSATAAVIAVMLALSYLSLQVRTLYHGPVLTTGVITDAEQYTYSAVWLAFGVVLLAVGIFLRSQAVRMASAAVVLLTVLKVFFIDMRDLTGIFQALSFIGLGVVLIGIGWFYQRLLFPRRAVAAAPPLPPAAEPSP